MGVNFEIYRAAAASAQAQYETDKAAAKARRVQTVTSIYQAAQVGSVNYEALWPPAMPGFPHGADSTDTFATVQAALQAADAQLATDLFAAEQRRQGAISVAQDTLNSAASPLE
jgi:hypothetical protein